MFNKGQLGNLMQQAQKMQEKMKQAQEELARTEVTGSAGAGMVQITINGKHEARKVVIDAAVMDDKEMLEDLVAAAINDAAHKFEAVSQDKMGGMTAGLGLPPGMKLPF